MLTDDDNTEIHAWFWVRTSLPKRVWKKCMEYEKMENGKIFKWHVDEHTNVPKKVHTSYRYMHFLNHAQQPNHFLNHIFLIF